MYQQIFELHAELLKALAHPRRLEILQLLREKELNVSKMQEMLGLPQANLSQHLTILREAGVVSFKKEGNQVIYMIAHQNFVEVSDLMRQILVEKYKDDVKFSNELGIKMHDLLPIAKDPVCGMRVSPRTASYAKTHLGHEYYFCAAGCLSRFEKDPSKFI